MAKIEGKSDGSINAQLGDGPNFIGAEVKRDSRVTIKGGAGIVKEVPTENGRFIGSVSARVSASAKVNGHYNPPSNQTPSTTDTMNLQEAQQVLEKVSVMTDGSGDLGKLSLEQVNRLREEHPALFSPKNHDRADNFMFVANQLPQPLKPSDVTGITLGQIDGAVSNAANRKDWQVQLDGALKEYAPDLSEQQRSKLIGNTEKGLKQADRDIKLPKPENVRKVTSDIDRLLKLDPELAASVSATGAYAGKNGVVMAGDITRGVHAEVGNVVIRREDDGNRLRADLVPTNYTSLTASVGAGSDTYSALPPELSDKLGVTPGGQNNFGGYVAATHSEFKTGSERGRGQTIAAGLNVSTKLGSDSFGYANVEAACSKSPAVTPKSDCKVSAKAGIKF